MRKSTKGASSAEVVRPLHNRERLKKVPIALRFDPKLLTAIDNMAVRRGMSRNAIISYWCSKGVESEG